SVAAEASRIESGPFPKPLLVGGENGRTSGPFSEHAVAAFAKALGVDKLAALTEEIPKDKRTGFAATVRQRRLVQEMEGYTQMLVRQSDKVRNRFFLYSVMPELSESQWSTARRHPTRPVEKFVEGAKDFRRRFWEEGMGRFDEPMLPFNARTRK